MRDTSTRSCSTRRSGGRLSLLDSISPSCGNSQNEEVDSEGTAGLSGFPRPAKMVDHPPLPGAIDRCGCVRLHAPTDVRVRDPDSYSAARCAPGICQGLDLRHDRATPDCHRADRPEPDESDSNP